MISKGLSSLRRYLSLGVSWTFFSDEFNEYAEASYQSSEMGTMLQCPFTQCERLKRADTRILCLGGLAIEERHRPVEMEVYFGEDEPLESEDIVTQFPPDDDVRD